MPGYEDSIRPCLPAPDKDEGAIQVPSHQVPCESGVQCHDQADIRLGRVGWLFQASIHRTNRYPQDDACKNFEYHLIIKMWINRYLKAPLCLGAASSPISQLCPLPLSQGPSFCNTISMNSVFRECGLQPFGKLPCHTVQITWCSRVSWHGSGAGPGTRGLGGLCRCHLPSSPSS